MALPVFNLAPDLTVYRNHDIWRAELADSLIRPLMLASTSSTALRCIWCPEKRNSRAKRGVCWKMDHRVEDSTRSCSFGYKAFLFKHCLVGSAVFGATKPWQLADVIEASKVHLAAEIISEIDEVHARYGIGRLYNLLVKEFVTN